MAGGIIWSGIVMIAPPNQGSTVAHQMSGLPGIGKLFQYADYIQTRVCTSFYNMFRRQAALQS